MMNLLKRSHRPLTGLLLFLILLLSFTGCSKKGGEMRAGFESGRFRIMVAFGDSIVKGYGQPEGWPQILERDLSARYPGVRVINAGVSGDTAADGLRRIERDVLTHHPDLVLIAFGLNDMKNGVSAEAFRRNISSIILDISRQGGVPVVLTTTRLQQGVSLLARLNPAPYNEILRSLSEERGIPLIDVQAGSKGLNTPEFLMDAAHPNLEGYRHLAEIIRKGLLGE